MYEEFFGLERRPFTATPDAANFVPLEGPQAALDALAVCCERGQGIGVLTGEAGLGKTLVGLRLAFELQPTFATVFLNHSAFPTRRSLLQAILFELERPYSRMSEQELRLELMAALKALRPQHQALVVILDEAHRLSKPLFDELRMLTLLAAGTEPMVRVVLIGNRDLEERLADPELSALNERICCQVDLTPLTQADSIEYLRTCINMAGAEPDGLFAEDALPCIAKAADGVPRCLNHLADHSLLLAYVTERRPVTVEIVREALQDLKQLPLHWNDPVCGGEIYRGLSQPVIEDSAVDLWPRTEQPVSEETHSADSWETTGFGQETAAIEIGCSVNTESPADNHATDGETDEPSCLNDNRRAAPAKSMSLDDVLTDVANLTETAEADCGRSTTDGSPDNSLVGQIFRAHELELGSPPQSFMVEKFATTHGNNNQPADKDSDDACTENECDHHWPTAGVRPAADVTTPFDLAEPEVPVWNLESQQLESDEDLEFEEEPVIDHYVRIAAGERSEGVVWNLAASRRRLAPRQESVAFTEHRAEVSTRENVPHLPVELRETLSDDGLEERIHSEVLGMSAVARQMLEPRLRDSDRATVSLERLADKPPATMKPDEPRQEFSGFDVVQPEPIRGKRESHTEKTSHVAQPDPIQRAYSRLFSDLRRKRKS